MSADPYNARLAIQAAANGRFNIGAFPDPQTGGATTGSWDLMYAWPGGPRTSFSTLRIDGSDYIYGSSGTLVQAPTDIDARTNTSSWQVGDIKVTQTLQLVANNQTGQEDIAKIAYTVRNTGTVPHAAGMRVLIDTEINANDGAPFRVPGQGIITGEREFTGANIPDTFLAFFNVTDKDHVTASTLKSNGATPPDRLVLANWRRIYNESQPYDYTVDPNTSFASDSAYAVYWNPDTLAPGTERTYATLYGLAQVTADLRPPLALNVDGPATLAVVNGQYSPNPFTVVTTVLNTGTAPATNVALTLALGNGLTLASGSLSQTIGDLAVGQERQVSWSVQVAAQPSDATLSYFVTATAANTDPKTVKRDIKVPRLGAGLPLLFVHGINDDYRVRWFESLFSTLDNEFPGSFNTFRYYQDKGYYDPGAGRCLGVRQPIVPAQTFGMPLDPTAAQPQSISPDICDSQSDLGLNAVLLDRDVRDLFQQSGGRKVVIVANSMGAAITRGFLAYSQETQDGVAANMVDSIVFIQGAQSGSYLADILVGSQTARFPFSFIGQITKGIATSYNIKLDRPAVQELRPQSRWYQWVNPPVNHVPRQISYFNYNSDLQVARQKCAFVIIGCRTLWTVSLGDGLMQPGTYGPFELPPEGGARFLVGAYSEQNWAWESQRTFKWNPWTDPALIGLSDRLKNAPENHLNIGDNLNNTQVPDCQQYGWITLQEQLLRILRGRLSGTPYTCVFSR